MSIEKDIRGIEIKITELEERLRIGTGEFTEGHGLYGICRKEITVPIEDVVKTIMNHLGVRPTVPEPVPCEFVLNEPEDQE